jgi:hypothetical protein
MYIVGAVLEEDSENPGNYIEVEHNALYYAPTNEIINPIMTTAEILTVLDVAHGGTGVSTLTNGVLIGNGTDPIISIPKGANSTYFGINANGEYA